VLIPLLELEISANVMMEIPLSRLDEIYKLKSGFD
jgi:hypothetical protein